MQPISCLLKGKLIYTVIRLLTKQQPTFLLSCGTIPSDSERIAYSKDPSPSIIITKPERVHIMSAYQVMEGASSHLQNPDRGPVPVGSRDKAVSKSAGRRQR